MIAPVVRWDRPKNALGAYGAMGVLQIMKNGVLKILASGLLSTGFLVAGEVNAFAPDVEVEANAEVVVEPKPIVKAFPTAEGFGATAVGGRGGVVYHVTNLNNAGPGSLRHGLDSAIGPMTVVFDVGGTIELQSPIGINKSYITLAGQTAPGEGIAVVGHSTAIGAGATDVIVRYMRFRPGDRHIADGVQDSLSIFDANRIIVDHVSTSWGLDETLSVTRSNNVTVQYSIIAEGLNPANHGYGSAVRGRVNDTYRGGYTWHHNLWINNERRSPAVGSYQEDDKRADIEIELINNVVHNWGLRAMHTVLSRDAMRINLVGNMFIAGPSARDAREVMRVEDFTRGVYVYESGNMIDDDRDASHDPRPVTRGMFHTGWFSGLRFEKSPFAFPGLIETQSAAEAYTTVLDRVGASLHRDAVDQRLVQEVMNRKGRIIDSQEEVGGYPVIATQLTGPMDTDRDGMPDAWEQRMNLDPNDIADGNMIAANGYTHLENYLNHLTGEFTP